MKKLPLFFLLFFMLLHPFPSQHEILITNSYETTISYARNRLREHALLATIPAAPEQWDSPSRPTMHARIFVSDIRNYMTH